MIKDKKAEESRHQTKQTVCDKKNDLCRKKITKVKKVKAEDSKDKLDSLRREDKFMQKR